MKQLVFTLFFFSFCSLAIAQAPPFQVVNPQGTPFNPPAGYSGSAAVSPDGVQYFTLANPAGTPNSNDTTAATWERVAIPAATIPSAYTPNVAPTASVTGLVNSQKLQFCRINNTANQPVSCSTDGTNDDLPAVPGNSTQWLDFASNNRDVRTSIVCKYTGSAPTTGTFYINCFY